MPEEISVTDVKSQNQGQLEVVILATVVVEVAEGVMEVEVVV